LAIGRLPAGGRRKIAARAAGFSDEFIDRQAPVIIGGSIATPSTTSSTRCPASRQDRRRSRGQSPPALAGQRLAHGLAAAFGAIAAVILLALQPVDRRSRARR
jgi:hypothetical protein